jgi:hypothetical protein
MDPEKDQQIGGTWLFFVVKETPLIIFEMDCPSDTGCLTCRLWQIALYAPQ